MKDELEVAHGSRHSVKSPDPTLSRRASAASVRNKQNRIQETRTQPQFWNGNALLISKCEVHGQNSPFRLQDARVQRMH